MRWRILVLGAATGITVLSALLVVACKKPTASAGGPSASVATTPRRGPFATTNDLVHDARIASLVDALAVEKRIESRNIGHGGHRSDVFAKFQALSQGATEEQLAALVNHESAVVRGYVGEHIAQKLMRQMGHIEPLLYDETSVETIGGCIAATTTVADYVTNALCWSELPEARPLIERRAAIGDGGEALSCLAGKNPQAAAPIIARLLAGKPTGKQLDRLLRLDQVHPSPETCAAALGVGDGDPALGGASRVLAECDSAAALARLEQVAAQIAAESAPLWNNDATIAQANILLNPRTPNSHLAELIANERVVEEAVGLLEARHRAGSSPALVGVTDKLAALDERFARARSIITRANILLDPRTPDSRRIALLADEEVGRVAIGFLETRLRTDSSPALAALAEQLAARDERFRWLLEEPRR